MGTDALARKAKKKEKVLRAVARLGKITDAARACGVSRDAIHDWRRNDPAFSSAFLLAKHAHRTHETVTVVDAIDFFTDAIRPFVSREAWPSVQSRIQLAAARLKFRARGGSDSRGSLRNAQVDVPMPRHTNEVQATLAQGNGTLHRHF